MVKKSKLTITKLGAQTKHSSQAENAGQIAQLKLEAELLEKAANRDLLEAALEVLRGNPCREEVFKNTYL